MLLLLLSFLLLFGQAKSKVASRNLITPGRTVRAQRGAGAGGAAPAQPVRPPVAEVRGAMWAGAGPTCVDLGGTQGRHRPDLPG